MSSVTAYYEPGRRAGKAAMLEEWANKQQLLDYELRGSWMMNCWLMGFIALPEWATGLIATHFARKVNRKYARYLRNLEEKRRVDERKRLAEFKRSYPFIGSDPL